MALGVGDIVRTTINFLLPNGVEYQNVFHHIFDGIGGVSDAAVVADIKTWAETMYDEIVGDVKTGTLEQLSYVDQVEFVVDQWEVVANIGTFTPVFVPTSASEQSANQIAPFVVGKTARPKSVGRKFMFPTTESGQNAGVLAAGVLTNLVAWADDYVNDIVIDVANDLHPGIIRAGVNDFLVFTMGVVTDLVGTQRRRRPGYGA